MPYSNPDFQVIHCYARPDASIVQEYFHKLQAAGIKAWMDVECIRGGEEWEPVIKKALRASQLALIFLSKNSVGRDGFLQKEILEALEVWREKPCGEVFLIPVRLDRCPLHPRLEQFHCVDLFEPSGWPRLLQQIQECHRKYLANAPLSQKIAKPAARQRTAAKNCVAQAKVDDIPVATFPNELFRFIDHAIPESWPGMSRNLQRFVLTLGCKLEPIVQIVPATTTALVLGFECLALGALGENFSQICQACREMNPGMLRICMAIAAIKTISSLRVEAAKSGKDGAKNLLFSINLDSVMLDSPHLKTFLSWYYYELQHNVIFEVNETTTKHYLRQLKNLQVDFNLRYSADDLNKWRDNVRTALIDRVEMTKMDCKSFMRAMHVRGDNPARAIALLMAHKIHDKPLIVEGIQDVDFIQFLEKNWDFKRSGHLYGQGYSLDCGGNWQDTVCPLKPYGLSGGSFLRRSA